MVKHCQRSQNSDFTMSLQYLIKEVGDEVVFLHAYKHKSFLQVDLNTLGINVSYKVTLNYWWAWPSILKVFRVTSFQCHDNISRKELRMEFFLHSDKHQNFYKLALLFLMEGAGHVQSTQNRKLVIFLQHLKSVATDFAFCYDAKYSDIFCWSSHSLLLSFMVVASWNGGWRLIS